MRRIVRGLLTPGTVVAMVALLVAIGGTSYAAIKLPKNSVGTPQLRNHAVTTKKLAETASARIAGVRYMKVTATAPPHTGGILDVHCSSGRSAIAGGTETLHTLNAFLLDSHPTDGGWQTTVGNGGEVPEPVTAWAVCAKVEGGSPKTVATSAHAASHVRWFALGR
jgi:hypothetical protein